MRRFAVALITALFMVISIPARAQVPRACDVASENLWVRDVMSDIYFWYPVLPNVDPVAFASPEAYLDAVRYRPLDNDFSYIASRAEEEAFFSDSQYVGLGFATSIVGAELRVLQVFPDSPAADAGFERGAWVREINGRTVASLIATNQIDEAFGPSTAGLAVDMAVEVPPRGLFRTRLVKRVITIPTVSLSRVYNVGGRSVGYLFFRNFVSPSVATLDDAFSAFRAARLSDLVLDLRYNGGGLVTVAQHLASLVGGARTDGQILAEYVHNDRNTFRDSVLRFDAPAIALGLDRLIVITTRATASASELVINALRPFIPVVVIGERSYGKPVGQYIFPFCDKVLAPVSFALLNARGEGNYFQGFAPQCPAPDDADHQLGDVDEASLHEALTYASTGACSSTSAAQSLRPPVSLAARANGWRSLLNAY